MDHSLTPFKIGKCQLDNSASSKLITSLSPLLRGIFEMEEWKLGDRQFRDLAALDAFANATVVEAIVIWLDFNKKPNIIEDILRPKYTQLTVLYLGDNNINSIEPISRLNSPILSKLFLNQNKITCLKAIRKSNFPKLIELNLNGNLITEEKWLIGAHFPVLEKLSLGYKRANQKIDENPWFLKAQMKDQSQIFSSKHRLHSFNRLSYYNTVRESVIKRIQPKDLFKTFEN